MSTRYVLGIDGGGTKTLAALAASDGRIIARAQSGPSNAQAIGEAAAQASLLAAIEGALTAAEGQGVWRDEVGVVVAGLAGVDLPPDIERTQAYLSGLLPRATVVVCNDGEIALMAGTLGRPGIVVVAGTGSIAIGSDMGGRVVRCGGWGHIIGDEGSAYAIVCHALRLGTWAFDGRMRETALTAAFAEALGLPSFDAILLRLSGHKPLTRLELAALAPIVARCAVHGDEAARMVMEQAGEDLALLAITVARRLGLGAEPFPVVCSGGTWAAGEPLLVPFTRRLHAAQPQAQVGPPPLSPVGGAVLRALVQLDDAALHNPDIIATLCETDRVGSRQ